MGRPKKRITATAKPHQWSEEEILGILETIIDSLLNNDEVFFPYYEMCKVRLPRTTLWDWKQVSPAIMQKYNEMKELSEAKIANELMKNRGKMNVIGGLFVLKAKYGWIEEEKARKTANDSAAHVDIEIGFEDENQDKS